MNWLKAHKNYSTATKPVLKKLLGPIIYSLYHHHRVLLLLCTWSEKIIY